MAHVMAVSKVTSTTCAPRSFTSNWPREKGPAFVGGAKEIVMQRGRLGGIPVRAHSHFGTVELGP